MVNVLNIFRRRKIFSEAEQSAIVSAIREAELNTSGEVRVYVERKCAYIDALDRAVELFREMGMDQTRDRNAVLLYVAVRDHQVAIYGDEGIHQRVGADYWKREVFQLIRNFNREDYVTGITACVSDIGEALKVHFPYHREDKNELPDDIGFGR
jgi:uncharacterized membrane protein